MIYCESCGHSKNTPLYNLKIWCSYWKMSVYPEDMDCGEGILKNDGKS
jgi:hypothetical protein